MLAVAVLVLASSASLFQETDEQRLARLRTIPAVDLARAYLANEYVLRMIDMARQGATVHLDGGVVVTAATADSVATEYQRRKDTYASVMRARGSRTLAGPHTMRLKKPCDEAGFFAVVPRQEEFRITLVLRHDMGQDELTGLMVEDVLMINGDDPADSPQGRVRGDKVELATRQGRCAMVLSRGGAEARPSARLEQPGRVAGTWEGKWDNEFGVRFTIVPADGGYRVFYEWQEYEGGAFAADTFRAYASAARAISSEFGTFEITFDWGATPSAAAVGHFGPRTRRARLAQVRTDP
jgi:hypothetical protein